MATPTGTMDGKGTVRHHRLSPFSRHFLQMIGVMTAGMIVSVAIFLTIVGMTWDEATLDHPLASLLVVAAGMTVPMSVWMLHRGMGVRNTAEMAAAMAVPVVPFLCLVWFGATRSAWCGAYCVTSVVAMVVLMRHRRDQYSMDMAPP
ncbi:MAG TPA: hypothetical protein VFJ85_09660 [Acidimicrobiales bacterium]|nr:hypothetical protein [Acidimicrobiales bacterium]